MKVVKLWNMFPTEVRDDAPSMETFKVRADGALRHLTAAEDVPAHFRVSGLGDL